MNNLRQKFEEQERQRVREELLYKLGEYEEQLEECKQGKCPEAGPSEEECFYVKGLGCLCESTEDGLFCEWLEHKISQIEETLANLG